MEMSLLILIDTHFCLILIVRSLVRVRGNLVWSLVVSAPPQSPDLTPEPQKHEADANLLHAALPRRLCHATDPIKGDYH